MSGIVVELCGLPGAGKTTLAAGLEETLATRGIPCQVADRPISAAVPRAQRAVRRLRHATSTAGRRPGLVAQTGRHFAAARNGSTRDTAAALVQWLAVCDLVRQAKGVPGVHVLEEGPVQTLWTLLLRTSSWPGMLPASAVLDTVPVICRSDLVLVVDLPVEVAAARLAARRSRHSRTQLLAEDQRLTELARGRELLDVLLAATPGAVKRLRLPTGATPAQVAADAADAVAGLPAIRA